MIPPRSGLLRKQETNEMLTKEIPPLHSRDVRKIRNSRDYFWSLCTPRDIQYCVQYLYSRTVPYHSKAMNSTCGADPWQQRINGYTGRPARIQIPSGHLSTFSPSLPHTTRYYQTLPHSTSSHPLVYVEYVLTVYTPTAQHLLLP